jgi:hypothetical protein
MDDAALRVKTSSLAALLRLRTVRERRALLDLQAARSERDAARDARDRAGEALSEEEDLRRAREARAYGALPALEAQSTGSLDRHRTGVERWTELVRAAAGRLDEAQVDLDQAEGQARDAQERYASRARAARKWTRIDGLIAGARRQRAEISGEQETEEETCARSPAGAAGRRP